MCSKASRALFMVCVVAVAVSTHAKPGYCKNMNHYGIFYDDCIICIISTHTQGGGGWMGGWGQKEREREREREIEKEN